MDWGSTGFQSILRAKNQKIGGKKKKKVGNCNLNAIRGHAKWGVFEEAGGHCSTMKVSLSRKR